MSNSTAMARVLLAVLTMTACWSPPTRHPRHTAHERQKRATHEKTTRTAAAPRPDIDLQGLLPDPAHELRWPRSSNSHPVLEPSYDIAGALAQPGISWLDLCRLGAQNRQFSSGNQDQVTYLRAWCSVAKHDIDDAIYRLAPLRRSPVLGIPAAIPTDLANIVVEAGPADAAELRLAKNHIDDSDILDMVAATYIEIGKLDDAFQINAKAIESNAFSKPATQCHRLMRSVVLGAKAKLKDIDVFFNDPTCATISNELHCWLLPATDCGAYFKDEGIDSRTSMLLTAYYHWPVGEAEPETWAAIANEAALAVPVPHADAFAVTALENALTLVSCKSDLHELQATAWRIRTQPNHDPALDARLAIVTDHPDKLCLAPL